MKPLEGGMKWKEGMQSQLKLIALQRFACLRK